MQKLSNKVVDFKRIKKHAEEKGFYPARIAREATVSRAAVYQIFGGKIDPKASTLKNICDVIGMPIGDAFLEPTRKAA